MSTETTENSNVPELTDELVKIVESGVSSIYEDRDPEPEDFTDTSDDAIDYIDDEEEDVLDDVDAEVDEDEVDDEVDDIEATADDEEEESDPVVKALAERGVSKDRIERARDIGLTDDQIKRAGSVKSLDIIEETLTKQIHDIGKKAHKELTDNPPEDKQEAQDLAKKTEAAGDQVSEDEPTPKKTGNGQIQRFDLETMRKEDYEPESWRAFEQHNQMVDYVETLEAKFESKIQELTKASEPPPQDPQQYVDEFDKIADTVMPEVFGKRFDGEKDTPLSLEHFERRAKLSQTFQELAEGYRAADRPIPSSERLMQQAAAIQFGDEMQKVTREASKADRAERIKKQAARRRSAGSSAGTSKQVHFEPGSAEALANDPDIRRLFEQASE